MASFSMEEFVGNGGLKGLLPKLLEEGWDDVPTLKIMNSEDKNAINMTQEQKVGYPFNKYSLHILPVLQASTPKERGYSNFFIFNLICYILKHHSLHPEYLSSKYLIPLCIRRNMESVAKAYFIFTLGCTGNQVVPA